MAVVTKKKTTNAAAAPKRPTSGGAKSVSKKSGLKTFKPGEVIFHENDAAESLYIIQSGQIRLFLPKGRGFVDIAILRTGEVIGEMAYFDEKSSRRSCSASAIITTQVIEISFVAFSKTMSNLNPWFKTIINTLADRLRKTNAKVKQLESSSVGFGKDGRVSDYKFMHSTDITKFLALFYLALKTHGELKDGGLQLHINKLKFYAFDVFNYPEIKLEEIMQIIEINKFITMGNDQDNFPKMVQVSDIETFRRLLLFFNTQRVTADDKKLKISDKCERLLGKIVSQLKSNDVKEDKASANLSQILEEFKTRNVNITNDDLDDAITAGLCGEVMVGTNNIMSVDVNFAKIKQVLPAVKFMNAINKLNESKAK